MRFIDYFGVNFEFSDEEDLQDHAKALVIADDLCGWVIETLMTCWDYGLMESGDTPSKDSRAKLLSLGVLCQTCHKDNDYTFSVTYPLGFKVINAIRLLHSLETGL